MAWGTGLSRGILALAVLTAGGAASWASKLDKTACNDLSTELGSVLATGVREDMERGPEWAKANLEPDRLANIKRLMQIEEQLEFRCGLSRRRILAKSPSRPKTVRKADDKTAPLVAAKKPAPVKAEAKTAAAAPASQPKAPPQPSKTATAQPQTTSAGKRRERSSTYVSPRDVNPFSLSRYGTTR